MNEACDGERLQPAGQARFDNHRLGPLFTTPAAPVKSAGLERGTGQDATAAVR